MLNVDNVKGVSFAPPNGPRLKGEDQNDRKDLGVKRLERKLRNTGKDF